MLLFSINRSRGYENPSLDIIVTERCSIGGCPLEEACEHCYLNQVLFDPDYFRHEMRAEI
jgi:hypothetical protein